MNNENLLPKKPDNTPMFVFDIRHTELKSSGMCGDLSKVAHKECFEQGYNLLPNYRASVAREIKEVSRAKCEFCGGRLNEVRAKQEEDAIQKWLATGDRTDLTTLMEDAKKRLFSTTGATFNARGAQTERMSATKPNLSARPQTRQYNPADVIARVRKHKNLGVDSAGAKIVTTEESRLADMSRLSDDELFDSK